MKINELLTEDKVSNDNVVQMVKDFLPLAMDILKLDTLPKFYWVADLKLDIQPSFGEYRSDERSLSVSLLNRHPNDILRTLAHELVHYKQDLIGKLKIDSGMTGSSEENEANAVAGIIMRHFNKRYPQYLKSKPL